MNPVDADARGRDDDQAAAKEGDEPETLRERQLGPVEGWEGKDPDEGIEEGARDGMGH